MVVENEPSTPGGSQYIGGRYFLFLELTTDEGITGIGERIAGSSYSNNLKDIQTHVRLVEEFVGQFVIGQNPLNIELLWDRMYGSRHDLRHPSLFATPVISGIDMALWDIAGKAANRPIYGLLGGQYHEKLRGYAVHAERRPARAPGKGWGGRGKATRRGQLGVQDRPVPAVAPDP